MGTNNDKTLYIIKRDKRKVPFDKEKIVNAIMKANDDVSQRQKIPKRDAETIANHIFEVAQQRVRALTIEEIQDMVENGLIDLNAYAVAKAYIKWRYKRAVARDAYSEFMQAAGAKLAAKNVENQNANLDEHSFSGRMGEAQRLLTKEYALKYVMSEKSRSNHLANRIYVHDLDSYASGEHNCLSMPLDELLEKGFDTRQTNVRGAGSVSTAMQLVAVLFQLQSQQQFGGVAATHLDWTMVPYVRKSFFKHYVFEYLKLSGQISRLPNIEEMDNEQLDEWIHEQQDDILRELGLTKSDFRFDNIKKLNQKCASAALFETKREVYQATESMFHNLNTLQSRSGGQLPFSSINYGTCTLPEGRMVTKAILDVSIHGLGKHGQTAIFPCGIFQCQKGVSKNPGDPNYDLYQLALKSTAQRLYPNYCNCDWSTDIAGRMLDIAHKRNVLGKLSPDSLQALTKWVEQNPDTARNYKLVLKDGAIYVDENIVLPVEVSSTMGCRTYNGYDINFDFNYIVQTILSTGQPPKHYFQSGNQKDGRGNLCPVTIILPTLAMEAREATIDWQNNPEQYFANFMDILDKAIHDSRDMLKERFAWICAQSPASSEFMYGNNTMVGYIPEEGIRSALKHGTLVIGQLGMAETLQLLVGCDQTEEKGMEAAKKIEQLFKDRCAQFKQEEKLNFGVYYTPEFRGGSYRKAG